MKQLLLLFVIGFYSLSVKAQSPGDTILVHSFNYGQTYGHVWDGTIRDTSIMFPTDNSISYSKVLMYYSIRCKDALVSPPVSGQTNIGCGEWDYSCNTYIEDSSRVDSFYAKHINYSISSFSGTVFNYVSNPMNSYYRYLQKNVAVSGTPVDTQSTVGSGNIANNELIPIGAFNAKRQYLYTASELISAGASAGNIDGIALNVLSGSSDADFLRIKLKQSSKTALNSSSPDTNGFTEVYFINTSLQAGNNNLQFYTPFAWDGTSNIIVEFSFYNKQASSAVSIEGSQLTQNNGILASDDKTFVFNGVNYVETNNYNGISGTNPRTVEAWIKTSVTDKEIVSWGKDQAGKKWVFRVNGNGALRVEVNGGYTFGTTLLNDNKWHHVACTFQGNSVNDIKLYVDGIIETGLTTANRSVDTDTTGGINLRISRGINNRYFDGYIDEVRLWDTQLSQSEISDWMYAEIDNSHPKYSNLQLLYKFDSIQNGAIYDNSGNARNSHTINGGGLVALKGEKLFKAWEETSNRPNITFKQGNYSLVITNDTILDTLQLASHNIKEYQVVSHAGSLLNDELIVAMDTNLWQAGDEITYDAISLAVVNTQTITADGSFTISKLTYTKRAPMKFEIMSFVTPYGIYLDLGPEGKTYTFDVTDYLPMLKGKKRITVQGGGQWQEDMDITFAFIVGTPERDVLDIRQLWPVQARNNASILSDEFFEPRDIMLNANASYFRIRSSITGHGQQGEFTPRNHFINISGGSKEFIWQVWKDDCGENPIYPQGGTWIYDRAGWCPGAATNIEYSDITQYVSPGQNANIDYGMDAATGDSRYIVNNQLVTYGDYNFNLDVAVTDILTPSSNIENSRENYICSSPTIMIKNTGSTAITSAVVEYWVNDATNRQSYTWHGSLNSGEITEVSLDANSNLWNDLHPSGNKFHVEIKSPNGATDGYLLNNTYNSKFEIPEVLPDEFYIMLRTNKKGDETSYKLYDSSGEIFHKNNLDGNKFYRDTFRLGVGCYKLEILDSDGDGLKFFGNNDGSGYVRIRSLSNSNIKSFQSDFGSSLVYNFTVNYPLSYEQMHPNLKSSQLYPNPNNGSFNISFGDVAANSVSVYDVLGKLVYSKDISLANNDILKLDLGDCTKGIYLVQLQFDNKVEQHKIIIE